MAATDAPLAPKTVATAKQSFEFILMSDSPALIFIKK